MIISSTANQPLTQRSASAPGGLSNAEQQEVDALQERDREVRAHEQAHLSAAGRYATGGIQYTFARGPDGRMYAIGGSVSVDTSEIPGDPEATLLKAQVLRRAALAPAEPSQQDRAVAAEMTRIAAEARQEIITERQERRTEGGTESARASQGIAGYAQTVSDPPASAIEPIIV